MLKKLLLVLICFSMLGVECGSDGLDESMKGEIRELFKNGATFKDPFVRSETIRIVTKIADPSLNEIAASMVKDESAMVRVAVLRALIAAGDDSARSLALNGFTNGKRLERKAILEAVYRYGNPPLKAELTARALRSKSDELKRIAFENGQLRRVDAAIEANNKNLLERTLYPELGRFVTEKDPQLAALALRKLIAVGQTDRARPLIENLTDSSVSEDERLVSAKILAKAGAEDAGPAFVSLIEQHQAALVDKSLGVPDKIVPPAVLRWAYLGLAAGGDEAYVSAANKYRIKADINDSIEVLEALASNGSVDAAISIRNAMKDARAEVRQRAIELYAARKDADPDSLNDALSGANHDTHVRISKILIERFAKEWVPMLKKRFSRSSEIDATLKMLRSVVTTKDDASKVLVPLKAELTEISNDGREDRAQLAKYLIAISDVDTPSDPELLAKMDEETLYGFLEFAAMNSPQTHRVLFRKFFYGDLFAIRLISAAGLWLAENSAPKPES